MTNAERNKMKERKYKIRDNQLVKRETGVPVPDDVPCFIFLGTDRKALAALLAYSMVCDDMAHRAAVMESVNDFRKFLEKHPERVKEPD